MARDDPEGIEEVGGHNVQRRGLLCQADLTARSQVISFKRAASSYSQRILLTMRPSSPVRSVSRMRGSGWDAAAIGRACTSVCPRCGSVGGAKLTKRLLAGLAQSFFVQGSVHRTEFGGAPLITFNDKRPTDIGACPGWPSGDAALFEEILKVGFFWYGPPEWQVGINENLERLKLEDGREQVIARIIEAYPPEILTEADKFYRLSKSVGKCVCAWQVRFDGLAPVRQPASSGQGRRGGQTGFDQVTCPLRLTRSPRPVCTNVVSRLRTLSFWPRSGRSESLNCSTSCPFPTSRGLIPARILTTL